MRLPGRGQLLAGEHGIGCSAGSGHGGERAPPGVEHRGADQIPLVAQLDVGAQILMGAQESRLVGGVRR